MTIKNELKENEKKVFKTKLRLNKETIRELRNLELKQAAGGYATGTCKDCPSHACGSRNCNHNEKLVS